MIHVEKPQPLNFVSDPKILRARTELQNRYYASSQSRMKFDMDVLRPFKKVLENIFHNKCAYCESGLNVAAYGQIDNFRPKAGSRSLNGEYSADHYWWLAYDWENLLPCCPICNKHKQDIFPIEDESLRAPVGAVGDVLRQEKSLLIDPAGEEPGDHLLFERDGKVSGLTLKGTVTIEVLGLNREPLIANRRLRAIHFENMLSAYLVAGSLKKHQSIKKDITAILEGSTEDEYIAVQRAVFKSWLANNRSAWDRTLLNSVTVKQTTIIDDFLEKADKVSDLFDIGAENVESIFAKVNAIKRFTIRSIEIKNFRSLRNLKLEIIPADSLSERESWLLLLGDNGVGKSSILQAIAMTLAGSNQLSKLKVKPKEILTTGESSGYVKIMSYESDEPAHLSFDRKVMQTNVSGPLTYVLGYGSTRLLPKGNLVSGKFKGEINIGNLFDYSIALTNVNAWLKSVGVEEFDNKIGPALHDLLDLDADEHINFLNGKLCIQRNQMEHDLEKVSDGFKSIIGLACDIMKTLSLEDAGYHTRQGIVLIDELGNHLHPRWRMKIVDALRKAFPKLQFIVSTHEPLCLRGLLHGEVVVLVEDDDDKIRALDKSFLPDHNLLRVDQLLTSDLFGLLNTLDSDTEKKYEEYYALLTKPQEKRNAEEKEKINGYTIELAEKENIGKNPQMQMFYELINEKYAQALTKDGYKTKGQLKEETVNEIKAMLKNKQLDWL